MLSIFTAYRYRLSLVSFVATLVIVTLLCSETSPAFANDVANWGPECPDRICTWTLEKNDLTSTTSCTQPVPLPDRLKVKFFEPLDGGDFRVEMRPLLVSGDTWLMAGELPSANPLKANYYDPFSAPPHYPGTWAECFLTPTFETSEFSGEREPVRFSGRCEYHYFGSWGYGELSTQLCNGTDYLTITRINPDEPRPNVVALEVNQVIQDWQNSVPLVEDKHTYVRAFIEPGPDEPRAALQGYLWGTSEGGGILPGSPLLSVGLSRTNMEKVRKKFRRSINFLLPLEWTKGTVRLELDVVDPLWGELNVLGTKAVEVTFEPIEKLDIKFVRIAMNDHNGAHWPKPSIRDIRTRKRVIKDIFPVAELGKWRPREVRFDGHPEDLIGLIEWVRRNDGCKDEEGCMRMYQGIIGDPGMIIGVIWDSYGGLAKRPGAVSWVKNYGTFVGRYTSAHELGHNLELFHTVDDTEFGTTVDDDGRLWKLGPCGSAELYWFVGTYETPNFPYLFDVDEDGIKEPTLGPMPNPMDWRDTFLIFGLSKYTNEGTLIYPQFPDAIDPEEHFALMSYCDSSLNWPWISKENYIKLIQGIHDRFGFPPFVGPPPNAEAVPYLYVQGYVNHESDIAKFFPFDTVLNDVPPDTPMPGEYSLRLVDELENTISIVSFNLEEIQAELWDLNYRGGYFSIPIEADPAIQRIQLLQNGNVLAATEASPSAPIVQMIYPNGGEDLDQDQILVEWTGSDADGDNLMYTLLYSQDDGLTWETMAAGLPTDEFEIDNASIAGTSQGLFKVKASDGFHTTWDESDAVFTVPNHPPEVFAVSPGGNPLYFDGQVVMLEAEVEDIEELSLPEAGISWDSSIDGLLGNGENLSVPASDLAEGEHNITVTATDAEGLTASDAVSIRIQRDVPEALADLSLEKAGPGDPVSVGVQVRYTLTVGNEGPHDATSVVLTDQLPGNLQLISFDTTDGNCYPGFSGEVTCTFEQLDAFGSESVTLNARVMAEGPVVNSASVTGAEPDPLNGNNTATHITEAGPFVPGPEVCDGLDNDLDGLIDDGFDTDGDGYTICGGDCDDNVPAVSPASFEMCNGIDDDCNGTVDEGFDYDGDGYTSCGGDCNDDNFLVHPDAEEICDLVDSNCNGTVDEGCNFYFFDRDADGFGDPFSFVSTSGQAPEWYIADHTDCDDRRNFVNPEKIEICNGIDDNCNGVIDEGDVCALGGSELPNITGAWDIAHVSTLNNCVPPDPLEDPGVLLFYQNGNVFTAGPYSGMVGGNVAFLDLSYGEETGITYENCNGRLLEDGHTMVYDCNWTYVDPDPEKNCSGTDTYIATLIDYDGDGFTAFDNDCDDNNPGTYPGAAEIPNNAVDENCDGVDLFDPTVDGDEDNYTPEMGDCDDYNVDIYPGAAEIPNNGIDEDCDGADLMDVMLLDGDDDGYSPADGDCDDVNPDIYPEAPDIPNNGIDENCDGADASLTNPDWYITMWNSGYSDWMISPHGHEQLSGEWAAAVLYDGIPGDEAMWLERTWICPDWISNSQFQVVTPFVTWDDPMNPVVGYDTGIGVISNGQVEITIQGVMRDRLTVAGLSPAVKDLNGILSHRYVMLQTYTIRNITSEALNNLSLFQMMHAQPNDDYGADNYGVYDPTPYSDLTDGYPDFHYDMTFFGSDVNWSRYRDDIVGFSSSVPPDAWGLGEFPSDGCRGGEPRPASLHHAVEANTLSSGTRIGPVEVAGAMHWDLDTLEPGQEVEHTVLFYTGHSPAGLTPSPGIIFLEPRQASNRVGTSYTLTATVTLDGEPVAGVNLLMEIVSGPHATLTMQATTDAAGIASFTYEGVNAGVDQIQVSGDVDGDANAEMSNWVTKEWIPLIVDSDEDGVADEQDNCPDVPNSGQQDSDEDLVGDACDGCPEDALKTAPGICGCGVADTDSDNDGTANCNDQCPDDPDKTQTGVCGCGISDADTDADGTPDCNDTCPNDPNKVEPGLCGCGVADTDLDGDGAPDCTDGCPEDPVKVTPGICGCGVADTDSDNDGTADCNDNCPNDPNKVESGLCGCSSADTDTDGDGTPDCNDGCPIDSAKIVPGICGCGVADTDTDSDGTPDCNDGCLGDPNKTVPGACGCGISDTDTDSDGVPDCNDECPEDANKVAPGICGCGVADTDADGDGLADCNDTCPADPDKTEPGVCGCGVADIDSDSDGVADCNDNCPDTPSGEEVDAQGCPMSQPSPTCDVNNDGGVDINDIRAIGANRGTTNPDYDIDGDGVVTTNDARKCVLECDNPRCVP